jgi:hypothetical protein
MKLVIIYIIFFIIVVAYVNGAKANENLSEPPSSISSIKEIDEEPPSSISSIKEMDEEPPSSISSIKEIEGGPPSSISSVKEIDEERTSPPNSELFPGTYNRVAIKPSSYIGEPLVTSYTPIGYVPASSGPMTIKKTATPVETGNGAANLLRVDVEITSLKTNKNNKIENIYIYEIIDDHLNLIPLRNNTKEKSNWELTEEFKNISQNEMQDDHNNEQLINFKKSSSLDAISIIKLSLLRDTPPKSANSDVFKKRYLTTETVNNLQHNPIKNITTTQNIFYLNKTNGLDLNDFKGLENFITLSKYLKETLGVKWVISNPKFINKSINITYEKGTFNITNRNDSTKWVRLQIIDSNKDRGWALLDISGHMDYYLMFDTPKANKGIWEISDWNAIPNLYIKSLSTKERLFYWYYVRPKKSGEFNTESIIRINDENYAGWPDIIYPMIIDVPTPDYKFEVTPILEGSNVFVNRSYTALLPPSWKKLKLKYLITYTGAASKTYLKEIGVMVEPANGCRYFNGSHKFINNNTTLNFSDANTVSLSGQISFNNKGTYQIPGLWIQGSPHFFKETVVVDDPIDRWWPIFEFYSKILTALLIILFNKELKGLFISGSIRLKDLLK